MFVTATSELRAMPFTTIRCTGLTQNVVLHGGASAYSSWNIVTSRASFCFARHRRSPCINHHGQPCPENP